MSGPRPLIRFWPVVPIVLAIALLGLRACTHETQLSRLAEVQSLPTDPPNTRAFVGFLHVPRGGKLVLGYQSTQPSALELSSVKFLAGAGLRKESVLVDAKPVRIRFVAAPGARLVWNPVGRRGDPEYVPPGVLSPDEQGAPDDRYLGDGLIALALLGLLVGSILFAQRHRLARVHRDVWIAIGVVFGAGLAVRLVGLGAAGETWDEGVNWIAGRNYIQNLLGGDIDGRSWIWNYEHPPIMKYLAGIGAQLSSGYGPARAISAVVVALGCALLVPIGKRLLDLRTGIVAAGIAALLPPMVAHGQIVGHEAPTVLWWALGILLALCVHDDLDSRRTLIARLAGVGAIVGVAVASRFINGLLGPLCVLVVLVRAPAAWRRETLRWTPVMVAACVLVFVAVWPRLWLHPIAAIQASFDKMNVSHAPEPFLGAITTTPPRYYFVVYLLATLPVGVLLAVVAGFVRGAYDRSRTTLVLAGWLVLPLLVAASPVRQDGVRYVMPAVLALAMIAGAGVTFVAARIRWRHALLALATTLGLYLGITLVRVSPYYLDYFGEHVGGAGTVARHGWFETAWWGEGLDRAIDYVNANAPVNARVDRSCIGPQHLGWFRTDLWAPMVARPAQAQWIVEYVGTKRCPVPPDATKVFELDADGAPLARVWQRP